jgi:predicted transcriptional regulator
VLCSFVFLEGLSFVKAMKHRRDEVEIIAAVLECIIKNNHKATKSKIMYGSYLSYTQLDEYLPLLIEKELIEYQKSEHTYRTTAKGLHYLNVFDGIRRFLK